MKEPQIFIKIRLLYWMKYQRKVRMNEKPQFSDWKDLLTSCQVKLTWNL